MGTYNRVTLFGRLPVRFQCTLINFIATEKGLEDQLLAKVVGVERPELEKQAQELQSAFNQASRERRMAGYMICSLPTRIRWWCSTSDP